MKAYLKNIRISPKKLRVVAHVIRGRNTKEALDLLQFMPNKGGKILFKLVTSAVANATHNDGQKEEALKIHAISVDKGIVYKRGNAVGRGRYHRILKRTSNVTLELESI